MPFKLQGSSTLVIQPCYDGRPVPGTHQVAGDGLALLSIKDPHNNCKLTCDSRTKIPYLSCAQGIKARNSFWNLHKPDLLKVGLERPSTESVMQLFQTHDLEHCKPKSYRKKVIRKLGTFLSKKSNQKGTQPIVMVQNTSWPTDFCVLSSLFKETEMVTPEILRNEDSSNNEGLITKKTIKKEDFRASISNILSEEEVKDTVFKTLPSPMHENTSDHFIPVSELLGPSNGDSFTNTTPRFNSGNPRICLGSKSYCEASSSQQVMSSIILLESKQSQHQISTPSCIQLYKDMLVKKSFGVMMERENKFTTSEQNHTENKKGDIVDNFIYKDDSSIMVTESPSSVVVQSIFSDIFQNIEEIKDAINSYMSSFYVHEEEYENFPALHKASKDVAYHFFEQIHGSLRDKNYDSENVQSTLIHSNTGNVQKSFFPENVSMQDVDINLIPESSIGNTIKNKPEIETLSSYCYWDDNEIANELTNDKMSVNTGDIGILGSCQNTALVPLRFIENMWEEFTTQVKIHALLLDLINENEMKKLECYERDFPSYGHWANIYDSSIFEEAENIVHTLDSFLLSGCFPADEDNNTAYIPCTILELVDDTEFAPNFEERPHANGNVPNNKDKNVLGEQENNTNLHKNEAIHLGNDTFMSQSPVNDMNNTIKIHEIKLEPVFNQEKAVIHEIYREHEYEKINLDPINYQGRVSFSMLYSSSSNSDLPTAVENKKHCMEEKIDESIISRENHPSKYFDISPNEDFLRADSKNQVTLEGYCEEKSLTNLDKDNSDTGSSMFQRVLEKNSPGNINSAFLFSSPNVQLNMTSNYFVNTNKK